MGFKLIIAGGRDFMDKTLLKESISEYIKENALELADLTVVSGHNVTSKYDKELHTYLYYGADRLGEDFAVENNLQINLYPADWKRHGKAAGPIRNRQMAATADGLLAFWDGQSRGTKSMIEFAKQKGLVVKVVMYNPVN